MRLQDYVSVKDNKVVNRIHIFDQILVISTVGSFLGKYFFFIKIITVDLIMDIVLIRI